MSELLTFLERYHALTERMLEVLKAVEAAEGSDDLIDTDALERLFAERDQLLADAPQAQPSPAEQQTAGERLRAIRVLEADIMRRMVGVRQDTQSKIRAMQGQKRATSAYQDANIYDAAFIDRKK